LVGLESAVIGNGGFMDSTDRDWLENRIKAAVDDDFYLDRDEEKRIKEEAASRGLRISDVEVTVQTELAKSGSVSERMLLDELERLLHQFTDDDKYLDRKEERDAFDQVVRPATGKRKGLEPQVAEDYVTSFCRVHGIRQQGTRGGGLPLRWIGGALAALLVVVAAVLLGRGGAGSAGVAVGHGGRVLTAADRAEIDSHLSQADRYMLQAQYTDPPERSAKAELDAIAQVDADGSYRRDDVVGVQRRIVEHYLALAANSARKGDAEGARQWIGRARLLNVESEQINAKASELGLTGQ